MSEWHEVGSLARLERDGRLVARVAGREIGVLAGPDGRLVAMRNRCPHHGAPLCSGRVVERLSGAPGSWDLAARPALRCPWHGWEFDLDSGRCLDEPSLRVAVYPVRVEEGRVLVEA